MAGLFIHGNRVAPPPAHPASGRITIRAHIDVLTGYGQLAVQLARELIKQKREVALLPINVWEGFGTKIPEDIRNLLVSESPDEWELLVAPPGHAGLPGKRTIHFTMWESGRLPPAYVQLLNQKEAIIVACEWCQVTFDAGGVSRPIYKIPLAVDTTVFGPHKPRPIVGRHTPLPAQDRPGPVVFGAGGRMAHGGLRKGIEEVLDAFFVAFEDFHPAGHPRADPRLEIKIFPDCEFPEVGDPRVTVHRTAWSDAQMAKWYRGLTAFVSAACAEGFGLMPLQAMACGCPPITTYATGHKEYLDEQVGYLVDYTLRRAQEVAPGNIYYDGYWYVPRRDSLVQRMQEVFSDPGAAAQKGARGVLRATQFTPARLAKSLCDTLTEIGMIA